MSSSNYMVAGADSEVVEYPDGSWGVKDSGKIIVNMPQLINRYNNVRKERDILKRQLNNILQNAMSYRKKYDELEKKYNELIKSM